MEPWKIADNTRERTMRWESLRGGGKSKTLGGEGTSDHSKKGSVAKYFPSFSRAGRLSDQRSYRGSSKPRKGERRRSFAHLSSKMGCNFGECEKGKDGGGERDRGCRIAVHMVKWGGRGDEVSRRSRET